MIKYGFILSAVIIITAGIYYAGYQAGKHKAELKVIKETVEVVKYVDKEKSKIYSKPNVNRDGALRLFNEGIL